jgi:pimeloyl-ACP methyl ester carboxylesterase
LEPFVPLFKDERHSRVITGDDGLIHFHELGEGRPLIFQQAFGPLPGTTAWLTWRAVVDDLSRDYHCILVDFPNFGLSGPREMHEPPHDVCSRNTFRVMDELGINSASIIGSSMGGTVAIDMALAHPDRVERLVIGACHASTGGDPYILSPFPSEVLRLFEDYQMHEAAEHRARRLLEALVYDRNLITSELVSQIYNWRLDDPSHSEAWRRSTIVPHSNMAALSSISVPVLVIHGRFDRMVPLEQALMLMSYMEQADLVVLNRCGHWPPFEHPIEYAGQLRKFFA